VTGRSGGSGGSIGSGGGGCAPIGPVRRRAILDRWRRFNYWWHHAEKSPGASVRASDERAQSTRWRWEQFADTVPAR